LYTRKLQIPLLQLVDVFVGGVGLIIILLIFTSGATTQSYLKPTTNFEVLCLQDKPEAVTLLAPSFGPLPLAELHDFLAAKVDTSQLFARLIVYYQIPGGDCLKLMQELSVNDTSSADELSAQKGIPFIIDAVPVSAAQLSTWSP
jgi:hypothetical protein